MQKPDFLDLEASNAVNSDEFGMSLASDGYRRGRP
jgi:hypothetical protein